MIENIIIGAGPAGLMCANTLTKHKIPFIILEKNEKAGKKLLITGNKRCNVTCNRTVEEFMSDLTTTNKKFLYSSLYTFGPDQVLQFFHHLGIEFVLEKNLKYFPKSNHSETILNGLLSGIATNNIKTNQAVKRIEKEHDYYNVVTAKTVYKAKNVIIATGSNSFPNTGSSGDCLRFAKALNVDFYPFQPAETHVFSKQITEEFQQLQGLSYQQVSVSIKGTKISHEGDVLFTHFGLSGPVIYHLSEFIYEELKRNNKRIILNFVNKKKEVIISELSNTTERLSKYLNGYFTKKHTVELLIQLHIDKTDVRSLSKEEILRIATYMTEYEVSIDRVESKERSYVNKGGISTKELHPNSMEMKKHQGLYVIGESTDLHGPIGGYNITIALSTGYLSALDIIEKEK